jgi:hypothetical protein
MRPGWDDLDVIATPPRGRAHLGDGRVRAVRVVGRIERIIGIAPVIEVPLGDTLPRLPKERVDLRVGPLHSGTMSIAVPLERLRQEIDRYGASGFLLTVGRDGGPHCVSVVVTWADDELAMGAGNTSIANAKDRPLVSLLWPPVEPGGYSLIVDATVTSTKGRGADDNRVHMAPTRAVLHRSAGMDPATASTPGPVCIPLYDRG